MADDLSSREIRQVIKNREYKGKLKKAITSEFFPLLKSTIDISDTVNRIEDGESSEPIATVVAKYVPEEHYEFNEMMVKDNAERRKKKQWAFQNKTGKLNEGRVLERVSAADKSKDIGCSWPQRADLRVSITSTRSYSSALTARPPPTIVQGEINTDNTRLSSDPLRRLATGENITADSFASRVSVKPKTREKDYQPVPMRMPWERERMVKK